LIIYFNMIADLENRAQKKGEEEEEEEEETEKVN
jgi:hypothetical protein